MSYQSALTNYLLAFVEGLKTAGVKQVVISPGSRSTPLALLLHRDPAIECFIDVDERSAAFFALGLIKATQQPVAIVCTSGSAAANYFPAICEAEATNLPLVVLTTDRPAELRGVGAPQATDQQQMYTTHVKAFVEMLLPEESPETLRYSHWQALTNVAKAVTSPKGPVHLNLPFREPLLPDLTVERPTYMKTAIVPVMKQIDLTGIAEYFNKKGLIVVGEERTPEEARQLLDLAERLGWPIVGDPLTNLANSRYSANYLKQSDLIFASSFPTPEVVLRFGRLPVTKNVMLGLKKLETTTIFVEDGMKWQEQLMASDFYIDATVPEFMASLNTLAPTEHVADTWLTQWQQLQMIAEKVIQEATDLTTFSESSAVMHLVEHLQGQNLFVANSNAIRFVDRLTKPVVTNHMVYGNRGVNGIDGLNSTVAGIAAGTEQPIVLLIGDLALFHDMNGLQMIRQLNLPVSIVLLNNNGGGIFSFLSQNQLEASDFEPLFGTPLDLDFAKVASLYDAQYHQPTDFETFKGLLDTPCFQIIEVKGDQKEPVGIWQNLVAAYKETLGEQHV